MKKFVASLMLVFMVILSVNCGGSTEEEKLKKEEDNLNLILLLLLLAPRAPISAGGTCFFAGTSGGCSASIPYTCTNSSSCSSSSTCSNLTACGRGSDLSGSTPSITKANDTESLADMLIADKNLSLSSSIPKK
jgi:hypothetical protein